MSAATSVVPLKSLPLARYDEMCRAIQACYEVDEVREWQSRSAAAEAYARIAHDIESERKCREIRVRAERRCGELLAEREMAKGGGTGANQYRAASNADRPAAKEQTLSDLGISKQQSSDWQKLAKVPEEEFETSLTAPGALPTAHGIVAAHEAKERAPAPEIKVDPLALWLWGALREFERNGVLGLDPNVLTRTMLGHMKSSTSELAPRVAEWLGKIGQ